MSASTATATSRQYFKQSTIYATNTAMSTTTTPGIAIVTGGRTGIGQAVAAKIASFPFIETVLS